MAAVQLAQQTTVSSSAVGVKRCEKLGLPAPPQARSESRGS